MKALEIVAETEFARNKQEMLGFLQGIDYDNLQERIGRGFSGSNGNLQQLKKELDEIKAKVRNYRRNTVSFPSLDKQIEKFTDRLSDVSKDFRQRIENYYEDIIYRFSKEFARAKKSKTDPQQRIAFLRQLSKEYNYFRELGDLQENQQIQDYYEFHLELEEIDQDIEALFARYKQIANPGDFEEIKEQVQEIRQRYDAAKKKRSSVFSMHPAFRYENVLFSELEKELKTVSPEEVLQIKGSSTAAITQRRKDQKFVDGIDTISITPEEIARVNNILNIVTYERFTKYRNILFLNELVCEHDQISEALKKKTADLLKKEAESVDKFYKSIEEKSKKVPERFEDVTHDCSMLKYLNGVLAADVRPRYEALGRTQDTEKVDMLMLENKRRLKEIKAVEREYDKIWATKRLVSSLKKEIAEKGATRDRVERLVKLNNRPRSSAQEIKFEGLGKDYNVKVQELIDDIGSAVNVLIKDADRQYQEAEKNPSYDIEKVIELYQQIHRMTDVSTRIERCYALQRQREKQDRENKLKSQIAELSRQKAELEEQNQLTEIQSKQYAGRIEELAKQLEAEKATYEGQVRELRSELSKRVYEKDDIVSNITSNIKNDSSFVLSDYLRESPEPQSYSLLKLKDVLEGRTGERSIFERLNQFSDYLSGMEPPKSKEDKEFLAYLFEGLKQDVVKGSTGRMIGASIYRRTVVNDTLNLVQSRLAA